MSRRRRRLSSFRTPEILGKQLVDKLNQPWLTIGSDVWTKQEMIDLLKCGNFTAAATLTRELKAAGIKSVKHALREMTLYDLLKIRGIGETSCYVFMCAVESLNFDAVEWLDQPEPRTLATEIKHARGIPVKQEEN